MNKVKSEHGKNNEFHSRRLFVGDLHGCREELDNLLSDFNFQPGRDRLFSVGDVVGKGPDVLGTLKRLKGLEAQVVRGNHDQAFLEAIQCEKAHRSRKQKEYLAQLEEEVNIWAREISTWPLYLEMLDTILVHAGLEPGRRNLSEMNPRVLMNIRTWDGTGTFMDSPDDPPWFECIHPNKTVVFGHWAKRGLVDLPDFKGLDTGCVYGNALTGWCPEENRFLSVPAKRAYSPVHYH